MPLVAVILMIPLLLRLIPNVLSARSIVTRVCAVGSRFPLSIVNILIVNSSCDLILCSFE